MLLLGCNLNNDNSASNPPSVSADEPTTIVEDADLTVIINLMKAGQPDELEGIYPEPDENFANYIISWWGENQDAEIGDICDKIFEEAYTNTFYKKDFECTVKYGKEQLKKSTNFEEGRKQADEMFEVLSEKIKNKS
ncbi:MAG: hypothetical protein RR048_01860 [Oscillospiraceae bacterium]